MEPFETLYLFTINRSLLHIHLSMQAQSEISYAQGHVFDHNSLDYTFRVRTDGHD